MLPMATDNQGRPLPKNTYQRGDVYRYKQPNGKFKTITDEYGKAADYELSCTVAEKINSLRDLSSPSIRSIRFWLESYIEWAESNDPRLLDKRSWRDRKNALNKFADQFSHININELKLLDLRDWWDGMTYDQQHNRRSAFSKFFQFCMSNEACTLNPFNTSDTAPKLLKKGKPEKRRDALELDQFWAIYNSEAIKSYPHVKIAMGISLVTGLREEDLCLLRFDKHVIENRLCTSIGKAVKQRGATKAAHHGYNLDEHGFLRQLINEARKLSLKHKRCPFILSYHQRTYQERMGNKEHISQVRPKKLSHDFATVRRKCGLTWKDGKNPASFHEIKGLYIKLGLKHYTAEEMREAAAHMDVSTTLAYPANHVPEYEDINVVMTEAIIGGKL